MSNVFDLPEEKKEVIGMYLFIDKGKSRIKLHCNSVTYLIIKQMRNMIVHVRLIVTTKYKPIRPYRKIYKNI